MADWLSRVYSSLFNSVQQFTDDAVKANLAEFRVWLNSNADNAVVRVWVDAGSNYGHQSSSANLVYRLAKPDDGSGLCFGYDRKIEIYYESADDLPKLKALIPELNLEHPKIHDATLEAIQYTLAPKVTVNLGITGGASKAGDYTKNLSVRWFLRLQPFKWDDPEQIQRAGQPTIDLTNVPEIGTGFADRLYYVDPVEYRDPPSVTFPDDELGKIVELLFSDVTLQNYQVLPTYSLQEAHYWNANTIFGAGLIVGSVMTWQVNEGKPYKNARPAVIVNFDTFGGEADKDSMKAALTDVLEGRRAPTEQGGQAMQSRGDRAADLNFARRSAFFRNLGSSDRFSYLNYPKTKVAVENAIGEIADEKTKVLFIQLGRTKPAIFRWAVSRANLPAFFEGQNTANLLGNIGVPYMQVPRPSSTERTRLRMYPNVMLAQYTSQQVPSGLQFVASQMSSNPNVWPETPSLAPCQIVGDYYQQFTNEKDTDTIHTYFRRLREAFSSPAKDKFSFAVAYLNTLLRSAQRLIAAEDNPLNGLYEKLKDKIVIGQPLNLIPGILTDGVIPGFIQKLLDDYAPGLTIVVEEFTHEGEPPDVTKITVSGPTPAFQKIGVKCSVKMVFTAPDNQLTAEVTFANADTWTMLNVPWVVLKEPYIRALVPNGKLPIAATFGGTYPALESKNPPITALVEITVNDKDSWPASIAFDQTFPSIAAAFQMATSINLVQALPSPFNALVDLGVSNVEIDYNYAEKRIGSLLVTAQSNTKDLPLFGTLKLGNIRIATLLTFPAGESAENRELNVSGSADFKMGAEEPATITVSFSYPGLELQGALSDGVITIEKVISTFLPEVKLSLPQVPTIDRFNFNYNKTTDFLSISLNFNIEWTFSFFGLKLFTLQEAGFQITREKVSNTGFITGSTKLLPDTPSEIGVDINAAYKGDSTWSFEAKQTSGAFKLNELLGYYLGNEWKPGPDSPFSFPDVDGLSLTVDWTGSEATAFEFNAKTASPWTPIPPLKEVTVTGSLKIGYKRPKPPADAMALAEADPEEGKYGEISATLRLWSIELGVTYSFNPKVQNLCITWLFVKGCLEKKDGDTIAVFTLNGKSIGEMVETFVSWATGASFGLVAPWNLLNDITLNGFSVTYNFTKKQVKFNVGIGPIDFGLFTLKGVSLEYDPDNKDRKVQITIDGSFVWDNGSSMSWDPTKPETTPAPPGGGNKYLDLRLLALGQHVTVSGLTEQRQVQDVIKMLRDLKVPSPPDIPVGGPGQPVLAPLNSWFVAFDFGLLKAEEKTQPAALTLEAGDDGVFTLPSNAGAAEAMVHSPGTLALANETPVYFIQLSVVFNDPTLYALRIALDGPMAKIFQGLDFQIMYRQVNDTVGCYSALIALPNIMRKFQVGVATITLPLFGIEVYTNGDFQVDIGFPWNMDFSRSFTIEVIIPPGIPFLGSAGFYFGKLSSATTDRVPKTTKGWFSPVLVFGFGAQIGIGKSIEAGILRAGFSITVYGIIEGVLARWQPYKSATPGGDRNQLQDGYYFSLTGTMGIQGRLYGTIDFAIIKASVDVSIGLYLKITFTAYEDIPITAAAWVNIKVSLEINLGLFSITISFSFSAHIEATFVLQNPMGSNPPWKLAGVDTALSLRQRRTALTLSLLGAADGSGYNPNWNNLQAGTTLMLNGWLAPVLTVAGDAATKPADQTVCYVINFFLPVPPPVQSAHPQIRSLYTSANGAETHEVAHAALMRANAAGSGATFEDFSVRVLQWVLAAGLSGQYTPESLDSQIVTSDYLAAALTYLSGATTPVPVPDTAIDDFLGLQSRFVFAFQTGPGSSNGVFFPAPPNITLKVPSYPPSGGAASPQYEYPFGGYNTAPSMYLSFLTTYFNELKVQAREEQSLKTVAVANANDSVASYIFSDYFALLGRQGVQALQDGLKNFKLVIDLAKSVQQIVDQINEMAQLEAIGKPYSAAELFQANQMHRLNSAPKTPLTVAGMHWQNPDGRSFNESAGNPLFSHGFTGQQLAIRNAPDARIIATGWNVSCGTSSHVTQGGDSLNSVAEALKVTLDTLLTTGTVSNGDVQAKILDARGLLQPLSILLIPNFSCTVTSGDTLSSIIGRFGVTLDSLAAANLSIAGLFDAQSDPNLNVPGLPQCKIGPLIDETRRALGLQNLGAMASRFYLHGLRLPTKGLQANYAGLFVKGSTGHYEYPDDLGLFALTGQAFPLPNDIASTTPAFTFTLTSGASKWLSLGSSGSNTATYSMTSDEDLARYKNVRDYALKNRLDTGMTGLTALNSAQTQASRFPLSQEMLWQTPDQIQLPVNTVTPDVPKPALWPLPSSMINVPNGTGPLPLFKMLLARSDAASGQTNDQPVVNYGFGTLITFSIRRPMPVAGSPATERLYELVGAPQQDIVLLEQLLNQLESKDSSFQQMVLLYRPASNSSNPGGWQSDSTRLFKKTLLSLEQSASLMGISQVNLSTETRPPMLAMAAEVGEPAGLLNVINTPTGFLRLLWEASITRQGGFYLNYTAAIDTDSVKGLPDHVFNDRGVAEVAVISLFKATPGDGLITANYMNVAATNQQLDLSDAALVTEAVLVPAKVNLTDHAGATLAGLAAMYYTDQSLLASMNPNNPLTATIKFGGGCYEVPAPGVAPGGSLAAIATYFNTTAEAIRAANPNRKDWPDPLPQYTGLILPVIEVRIGTDPGGNSFGSLSRYYNVPIAKLAAAARDKEGLFGASGTLDVMTGPLDIAPATQPGVVGFHTARKAPSDPDWGKNYLLKIFNLLGYRVFDNPDFRESNWGLPGGPADPSGAPATDKIVAPRAAAPGDPWDYTRTAPYPSLYKYPPKAASAALPTPADSPYLGVGGLIQFELAWQDLFGNRILTNLSMPQSATDLPPNRPPQITGYTDRLTGIGQWPSVANDYLIAADPETKDPVLTLRLAFDQAPYLEPDAELRIRHALKAYAQILYQLQDPNHVDLLLVTSVTPKATSLLSEADKTALIAWVENIYLWLQSLLSPPPLQLKPDFSVTLPLDASLLNTDQIFMVSAEFIIRRKEELVEGALATSAGVWQAVTSLAPRTGPIASTGATDQREINAFATAFKEAFAKVDGVSYRIATGEDRYARTGGTASNLWALQLGLPGKSKAVSYTVSNTGNPRMYAPRPVSNQLQSRAKTAIIPYQTGKVINPNDPPEFKSFSSIDSDQWMQTTLTAIDALLSPRYVAPAQILQQKTGVDSLQMVLDAKKALAGALKRAMIPVFYGETASDAQKAAVQEVFYQTMLGTLSQYYAVKTGIQFDADVNAAIRRQPGDTDPPRIFGDIVGQASPEPASGIPENSSLSSPKLNLKFAPGDSQERYLSFLLSSTSSLASVALDLEYTAQNIEQQIGTLPGIVGYQPSTWLSFTDASSQDWPLRTALGQFQAPIMLRAFPATPTLVQQLSVIALQSPCYTPAPPPIAQQLKLEPVCDKPGNYNPLAGATLWNYGFEYAQANRALQDAVHGMVSFNISQPQFKAKSAAPNRDLFDNLAEFTQIYPQIEADLNKYLAPLDVATTDAATINNAQAALQSAAAIIQWIASSTILGVSAAMLAAGAGTPPYPFTITEDATDKINPDKSQVKALVVIVKLPALPPARVGKPLVQVQPDTYECEPDSGDDTTFRFVYKNKLTGQYLTVQDGLQIAGRTFILPDMDVLERQDAESAVYLTRNENIAGRRLADVFVYTTPTVTFPGPLLPTLQNDRPVNLATIYATDPNNPVTRILACQLSLLYETLFQNAGTDSLTLAMTVYYEYSISAQIQKIRLPVFLMPPTLTAIRAGGQGVPIADLVAKQAAGCQTWFSTMNPVTTDGTFFFELTAMSNLTLQPMPVLKLTGLYVPLVNLTPTMGSVPGPDSTPHVSAY